MSTEHQLPATTGKTGSSEHAMQEGASLSASGQEGPPGTVQGQTVRVGGDVESFAHDVIAPQRGDFLPNGKFAPGNRASVGRPNPGAVYRKALAARFPPEKLAEMVVAAWDEAEKRGSARGMAAVLAFVGGYTMGKPKVMQEDGGERVNLRDLLAMLPDDVAEPGIIDAEPGTK